MNVLLPNFEYSNLLAGSVVGVEESGGVELTVPPPSPQADIKTKSTKLPKIFIIDPLNIQNNQKNQKNLFTHVLKTGLNI